LGVGRTPRLTHAGWKAAMASFQTVLKK